MGRLALLLLALLTATVSHAAPVSAQFVPQCSDGLDNDGDNYADGMDKGCGDGDDNDESDSPYAGVVTETVALPVVTIQGTVDGKGILRVARFTVEADRGTQIDIRCGGAKCPFKRVQRTMLTTKLRIKQLERKRYAPPMVLRMRLQRAANLGKFVRYTLRRNKAPKRFDSCLDEVTGKIHGCFEG